MANLDADRITSGTLSLINDGAVVLHTFCGSETQSEIIVDLDFYNYKVRNNQLILTKKEETK